MRGNGGAEKKYQSISTSRYSIAKDKSQDGDEKTKYDFLMSRIGIALHV